MNRKIIIFLLLIISICAISHVSAADNSTFVAQDDTSEIEVQSIEETDIDAIDDTHANDGENSFRNIQRQIDAAQEGDTIYLNGTYVCDYLINVNKNVNIVGDKDNGAVITYNGTNDLETPFFNICPEASNVVLSNIKFIGGAFFYGGAITWQGDNGTITDCEFIDNTVFGEFAIGGAILVLGENCIIENSIFKNNHAYCYGGAILAKGNGLKVTKCEFYDNMATGKEDHGGAIVLFAANCIVSDCIFNNNHCNDHGGAISSLDFENITIRNCNFTDNYVTNSINGSVICGGGAVFSISPEIDIDNCTFIGNHALKAWGGAINIFNEGNVVNSYFANNSAQNGADIYTQSPNIISNYFVLDYGESIRDAVDGINMDSGYLIYILNNTFNRTKHMSEVIFTPGLMFEYGQSGSINVSVEGGFIEKENIRVLNQTAKITFKDGVITVSNLPVGNYVLRVTTTPDENHTAVDADLNFTVKKSTAVLKASKITVALKSGSRWTITVVDKNNKPISGMYVTLKIYTGNKYKTVKVKTNSKGEAIYNTKDLLTGTHKVIISGTHSGYDFKTLTSSIKVITQTAISFKLKQRVNDKKMSLLSYMVVNKKTGKGINGVKIKCEIYTGKKCKTYYLTTKKLKGKVTYNGAFGFSTNAFSAGKHVVKLTPTDIKYKGSVSTYIIISKAATKGPKFFNKI